MPGDTEATHTTTQFSMTNITNFVSIKLNGENYLTWKHQMVTILKTLGLLKHIDPNVSIPTNSLAHENWSTADGYVCACINATLDSSKAHLAVDTITASELWKVIEDSDSQQVFAKKSQLKVQFQTLKQSSLSVTDYCDAIKKLADSLRSVGDPVSEVDLVMRTLQGLNPVYNTFVLNIENSDTQPTFAQLRSRLLIFEERMAQQSNNVIPVPAMSALTIQPPHREGESKNDGVKIVCQICHKTGHDASKCFFRFAPITGQGSSSRASGGGRSRGSNSGRGWRGGTGGRNRGRSNGFNGYNGNYNGGWRGGYGRGFDPNYGGQVSSYFSGFAPHVSGFSPSGFAPSWNDDVQHQSMHSSFGFESNPICDPGFNQNQNGPSPNFYNNGPGLPGPRPNTNFAHGSDSTTAFSADFGPDHFAKWTHQQHYEPNSVFGLTAQLTYMSFSDICSTIDSWIPDSGATSHMTSDPKLIHGAVAYTGSERVIVGNVLCRKRAVDRSLHEEQWNLARWAQESIKEGSLKHIIDSDIRGQISPKCLKEFVRIAQRCLHSHPKQRPTMAEVVVCLQSVLTLQEKISSSSHTAGRTIFGRLADMLPFPSNEENYAHGDSKLSSNRKGSSKNVSNTVEADNMLLETKEPPTDCRIPSPNMKVFKFDDLKRATRNFGLDLGLGIRKEYSGQLFLGYVDKNTFAPSTRGVGIAVAVSRRDQASVKGHAEWLEEVSIRERLAHPNIISVVGYCNDEHENLLVYEYMENQSFDHFLFRGAPDNAEPLSWGTRLIIMMGVARGLAYLHSSKDQSLYHDVKSHNIFLDQDFNAKLGDFGLIRSHFGIWDDYYYTRVISFDDHEDPEYILTGNLNAKSDIYSFGVVLLETLTGLRGIDHKRPRKQMNLVAWARPILERKKGLEKLMDPRLEQNYPLEGALRCGALILTCIESNPKMRPSSEEVLQSLEQIYAINREGPLQT